VVHSSIIYLLPVHRRRRPAAEKVTVAMVTHWTSGYNFLWKGENLKSTLPTLKQSMAHTAQHVSYHCEAQNYYCLLWTVCTQRIQKNQAIILSPITLRNSDRSSKFFHPDSLSRITRLATYLMCDVIFTDNFIAHLLAKVHQWENVKIGQHLASSEQQYSRLWLGFLIQSVLKPRYTIFITESSVYY